MALRTDINVQFGARIGRTGLKSIPATAGHGNFMVLGMNICFHFLVDIELQGKVL